jgi:hypothetical protein
MASLLRRREERLFTLASLEARTVRPSTVEAEAVTGETRHQSNRGGWRRVRTRHHRRRRIKKYANPHRVYFNSIIILENIIIPSTSLIRAELPCFLFGLSAVLFLANDPRA